MGNVDKLLARLNKVKATGPGRWIACCPAHNDRSPSLSVRETNDGTVLVKCWSGCGAAEVMAAVELTLSDLFPEQKRDTYRQPILPGERWIPRDVLVALASEALIVLIAADSIVSSRPLNSSDVQRVAVAAGRLRAAAKEVGCHV